MTLVERRRWIAYLGTVCVLGAGHALLRHASWTAALPQFAVLESTAAVLAFIVGAACLMEYHAAKRAAHLFIGCGFLGAGILDGYQALVASGFLLPVHASLARTSTPAAVLVPRLYLSLLLLLSGLSARQEESGSAGRVSGTKVCLFSGGLLVALVALSTRSLLSGPGRGTLFAHRPGSLLAALLFTAAFVEYWRAGRWRQEVFEHWLMLSLLLSAAGEGLFMSPSVHLLDPLSVAGDALMCASYVCAFIGLALDLKRRLREGRENMARVDRMNRSLQRAMSQRQRHLESSLAQERVHRSILEMTCVEDFEKVIQVMGEELERLGYPYEALGVNVIDERAGTLTGYTLYQGQNRVVTRPLHISRNETVRRYWRAGRVWERRPEEAERRLLAKTYHPEVIIDVPFVQGTLAIGLHGQVGSNQPLIRLLEGFSPLVSLGYRRVVDMAQRARDQEALRQARDEAEQANRAKDAFLANISHEIRTPMNAIMGMTQLLMDMELPSAQREYVQVVRAASDSLLSLLDDVLDLARIEAQSLELERAPFSLRECLDQVVRLQAPRAEEKGLELAYQVHRKVPSVVVGDSLRLRQVLLNLVDNAVKFTSQGEVLVIVEQAGGTEGGVELEFTVRDTGIGISPDKQEAIFEAFSQADSSTTRRYGGTGLGLAITARLVKLMDGRIWVDSEPGRGTAFHVTIRLGRERASGSTAGDERAWDLKGVRVLVVDGSRTHRRIIEDLLDAWGAEVTSVTDAETALTELRKVRDGGPSFQTMLLDAATPGMGILEFLRRVRRERLQCGPPIVMHSLLGGKQCERRCGELGVRYFLHRLVGEEGLRRVLSQALSPGTRGPATRDERHHGMDGEGNGGGGDGRPEKPLSILLVEDDAFSQLVAARMLERHGHSVEVAQSGREALQAVESREFDLVIMDVQMPELDGLEATRILREKERVTHAHLPVIGLTAGAQTADQTRCLEAGMDVVLSKPLEFPALMEAIGQLHGEPVVGTVPEMNDHADEGDPDAPLDREAILDRVDGNMELLQRLIELFYQNYPPELAGLREALELNDTGAVARRAHALRGMVRFWGAPAVDDLLAQMERGGRNGEITGGPDLLRRVSERLERLGPQLETLIHD